MDQDEDNSSVGGDGHPNGKSCDVTAVESDTTIAKKESKAVFCLRVAVFLVLFASAAAVITTVYLYIVNQEQEEFVQTLDSASSKVFDSIGQTLEQTLGATDSYVTTYLSYARYSSPTNWPFIVMPGAALHTAKMIRQAKAFSAGICIVVEPEEREAWADFSKEKLDSIIQDSQRIQATDSEYFGPSEFPINNQSFTYDIWNVTNDIQRGPVPGNRGNYLPVWQQYPIIPHGPLNWDTWLMPSTAAALRDIIDKKRVAFVPTMNVYLDESNEIAVANAKRWQAWAGLLIGPNQDPSEPAGTVLYPMYDYLAGVDSTASTSNDKWLGVVVYNFFWRAFLENILPQESIGVIVVMTTPCDIPFTYRLDGPTATYLGPGDLHDHQYDNLKQTISFNDIMGLSKDSLRSSYTGIPLSETHCPRYVHVYPSQDMENEFKTNLPIMLTLIAAAIFLFTSFVFITYDYLVAHRQKIVMRQALASGAIVSSLFPERVKQQLYEERKAALEQTKTPKNEFMNPDVDMPTGKSKPIADLFDETTIFFADLA